ncbi:hypothetical protein [Paenibacillus dendritiformis]|uniref:hypothetical protein n=1 Tax=Paenibacillus dendritiformis TaxID=130049 RepID=UPI00387E0521
MDTDQTITIAKSEYERLLRDSEFLGCLEACGVDNWGGYSEARELMELCGEE